MVEDGVSFVIAGNKADMADLGLKIGVFVVARFCFTKASFSQFFSQSFFYRPTKFFFLYQSCKFLIQDFVIPICGH